MFSPDKLENRIHSTIHNKEIAHSVVLNAQFGLAVDHLVMKVVPLPQQKVVGQPLNHRHLIKKMKFIYNCSKFLFLLFNYFFYYY